MNSRPIGVFDSGLGGLTVVRELAAAMPGEDILYLGDTARVPYGIKSPLTIQTFARQDSAFLLRHGPKMLVVACNTASAAAIDMLRASSPVEVIDVIQPSAEAAVRATQGGIGVIATEATIASGAYQRSIAALAPGREVMAVACPLLVPLVEEGRDDDNPILFHVLYDYLGGLQRFRPGVLVLGCTHYPLLSEPIRKVMGPDVVLISSGQAAAMEVQRRLRESALANPRPAGGTLRCFTTDNPERFAKLGERFGQRKIDHVELVGTDELEKGPVS